MNGEKPNKSKLHEEEQTEFRKCLLSLSAESFVFHSAIQKCKD